MPLIADRFLRRHEDGEIVDLATGEAVRLAIGPATTSIHERAAACDRLSSVRHPLLLPLVDYGMHGPRWFEAHARLPPLRVPGAQARQAAQHLVRFLRAAGVELDAGMSARNVRPAIDAAAPGWRPIGVFLQWPPALDVIRSVIESAGPPGVTAITVHAPDGGGLHTARLQIARAARLGGFLVIDSRFGALEQALAPPRHVCVLEWLPASAALPAVLTVAAAAGARRHLWIRFCRQARAGGSGIGLEPLMMRELTAAIYVDAEFGPSAAEVRAAAAAASGRPGLLIDSLSSTRARGGAAWLHETAPEYVTVPQGTVVRPAGAGIARLERAVTAALALARRGRHARAGRILRRAASALAARGAATLAASAYCALGDLYLDRGQPRNAATAFEQARQQSADPPTGTRALIGSGRALMEDGRLLDAEAAFRTAALGDGAGVLVAAARRGLALVLGLRGRLDAAEEAAGSHGADILAWILRLKGDLAGAAHAVARAIREAPPTDCAARCEAHLAALHLHDALGQGDEVREHARLATETARGATAARASRACRGRGHGLPRASGCSGWGCAKAPDSVRRRSASAACRGSREGRAAARRRR